MLDLNPLGGTLHATMVMTRHIMNIELVQYSIRFFDCGLRQRNHFCGRDTPGAISAEETRYRREAYVNVVLVALCICCWLPVRAGAPVFQTNTVAFPPSIGAAYQNVWMDSTGGPPCDESAVK